MIVNGMSRVKRSVNGDKTRVRAFVLKRAACYMRARVRRTSLHCSNGLVVAHTTKTKKEEKKHEYNKYFVGTKLCATNVQRSRECESLLNNLHMYVSACYYSSVCYLCSDRYYLILKYTFKTCTHTRTQWIEWNLLDNTNARGPNMTFILPSLGVVLFGCLCLLLSTSRFSSHAVCSIEPPGSFRVCVLCDNTTYEVNAHSPYSIRAHASMSGCLPGLSRECTYSQAFYPCAHVERVRVAHL